MNNLELQIEIENLKKRIDELEKSINVIIDHAGSNITGMSLKDRLKELKIK